MNHRCDDELSVPFGAWPSDRDLPALSGRPRVLIFRKGFAPPATCCQTVSNRSPLTTLILTSIAISASELERSEVLCENFHELNTVTMVRKVCKGLGQQRVRLLWNQYGQQGS